MFLILVYVAALFGAPIGLSLFLIMAIVILGGGILLGRGVPRGPVKHEPWTPAEAILVAALLSVSVLAAVKAVFFPVVAIDAHAYAGRALAMLHDRTLNIRFYHWPEPPTSNSNLSYPPLMSLAYAVSPAFGCWQHKIVNVFLALAWPLAIFETLRPRIPRFAALAWVLVLGLTPELFAHISFDLLNLPAMALALGEAICLAGYLESGARKQLLLAGALAAGMCGIRPDGAVIHGALWIAVAIVVAFEPRLRSRVRSDVLFVLIACLAPVMTLGTWAIYMHNVLGLSPVGPLSAGTPIGFGPVLRAFGYFPLWLEAFGITFYLFALALPWFGTKRRRESTGGFYLAATCITAIAIAMLFSRIDRGYGGGLGAVLPFSFKRSLFYLVPLSGLASALSPWGRALAFRGHGWVHHGSLDLG